MGAFFVELDRLLATSKVIIDRPAGGAHPRFPAVHYPMDYGYLDGTIGGDREGVDTFVGSTAGLGVVAAAVTVDPQRRDAEVKVLVDCSPAETAAVSRFLTDVLGLGVHLIQRR